MSKVFIIDHYRDIQRMSKDLAPMMKIPGKRVRMRQEDLFNIWIRQHRRGINNLIRAFQDVIPAKDGPEYNDYALTFFTTIPEIVEHGDN